jgi:PilZ domain
VTWPVVVEAGDTLLLAETANVSPQGSKLKTRERLPEGTLVSLHFHPPDGAPLDISAVVWRTDPDGLAFLFVGTR